MSEVGLNENIVIGERVFHIQTSTMVSTGFIKAELFEKGRLLNTMFRKFERRDKDTSSEKRIKQLVDTFHKSIIHNINNIFNLSKMVKDENSQYSHLKIGILFFSLNLYSESETHLNQVIKIDTKNQNSYKYLIKLALKKKELEKAKLYSQKLKEQTHKFADVYNIIGAVEYYDKKYIDAIKSFKKAISLNQNYLEAYINLLMVFIKSYEKVDKTINEDEKIKKYSFLSGLLDKAEIALATNHEENRYLKISLINIREALDNNDYKKTLEHLRKLHVKFFNEVDNYRIIGYEIFLRMKYDLPNVTEYEIELYEENIKSILSNHPEYTDLWNVLGLIYIVHTKNLFNIALENYSTALALNKSYQIANKNRRLVENDGKEIISILNSILK